MGNRATGLGSFSTSNCTGLKARHCEKNSAMNSNNSTGTGVVTCTGIRSTNDGSDCGREVYMDAEKPYVVLVRAAIESLKGEMRYTVQCHSIT